MPRYSTPSVIETPWRTIEKTLKALRRNANLFRAVNSRSKVRVLDVPEAAPFNGNYLISSDRGLFALQRGKMFRLTTLETYGMAVRGQGELFMAVSNDDYSSICRCRLPVELDHGAEIQIHEIYRIPIHRSGRVHQIAFYKDTLAITQTATNSIVFLNPDTGAQMSECTPFRDRFGKPIRGDHNHINSVSQCGECLLFCAYKAGASAMIGVIQDDRICGYSVSHLGAHDVHITGNTLYYSDTFGATFAEQGGSECGFLMANGAPVDREFFSVPPGFSIRGVCQQGAELILGHSHKGSRAKRFDGSGALFRLVNGKVVHTMQTPFAQTYDIIGMDGRHFDAPPRVRTWDQIHAFLEPILGRPVYEYGGGEAMDVGSRFEMAAA